MPKVLVVDDSLSVRKVVERALIGRQIEVVCAATGTEALERIEREEPDVVVCDVVMPDRDGYEICEFVKRHPPLGGTPVLLMSAVDPEVAGALSACLAESSEGLGRELNRGALQGMILEYEHGMVVLYSVGASALLAIGLSEAAVLGKVRYYAKKTVPELLQAV